MPQGASRGAVALADGPVEIRAVLTVDQQPGAEILACELPMPDEIRAARRWSDEDLEHFACRRTGDQIRRFPFHQDPAVIHDDQPVAEPVRLLHVVGGEQDREPLALQTLQALPDLLAACGSSPVVGSSRISRSAVDQRSRQHQPPQHAAGELLHPGILPVIERDEPEQLLRSRFRRSPGNVEIAGEDDQVLHTVRSGSSVSSC